MFLNDNMVGEKQAMDLWDQWSALDYFWREMSTNDG